MKKIGVILSGCGVYDGAEIQEAVLTLLYLDLAGAQALCFAPNVEQHHVINHLTGNVSDNETRNVLVESARIARGQITDLKEIDSFDLDGLILPGGFGAAKNLCDYAFKGPDCEVIPEVAQAINSFLLAGKPVGFMCIAPVIAAKLLGGEGVELTIGNEAGTGADIEAMGAVHLDTPVEGIVVSSRNNIISTPAYMLGPSIRDVAKGIEALVRELLERC
ncbi:MAG: isoprenoid biosynthesis glyoxalase ElbB [Chlorobiaceae bacterium]|nr:isoprenoid biosynthesis glyoxalase ElbB [Chlorobiaceae bacterium]